MATQVSGASSWLTLNGKPLLFNDDTENLDAGAMEYTKNYFRVTAHAPFPLQIFIDQQLLDTDIAGRWLWRPRAYAGLYELRVNVPDSDYPDAITKVRVAPQHFTQTLYQKMQNDLSAIAADLLFSLVSTVSERVENVRRLQESSPLQEYRHVRVLVERLGSVMSAIRREPYRVLRTSMEQRDWREVWQFTGESQAVGGDAVRITRSRGNQAGSLVLPTTWKVPQTRPSYDVYENRLLKQFVQKQLIAKLNAIQQRAEAEIRQERSTLAYMQRYHFNDVSDKQREIVALERAIAQCNKMKQRCLQWSSEPFLQTVHGEVSGSKATQVLLKHPDYSRFYKLYLQFQQQLQISLNSKDFITEVGLRKIYELYEMWSVFEITKMVLDELKQHGYEHVSQSLFYEIDKQSFHFEVHKNVASIVLAKDDMRVQIIYEPQYPNVTTTREKRLVTTHGRSLPQTPDMAIEIYERNIPYAVCIFDAKYKRKPDFSPVDEDLDKMTNYATNIRYQYDYDSRRGRPQTRNIVTSAYVLYPGNRVYEEANGEIGGLPLRPAMSPRLIQDVRQKLSDILYDAGMIW